VVFFSFFSKNVLLRNDNSGITGTEAATSTLHQQQQQHRASPSTRSEKEM
jgi:hypothetical protein